MNKLAGKVAIVSGASKGIGAAIALEFASHGASVVINHRNSAAQADEIADQIRRAGGKALVVQSDIASEAGASRLVHAAISEFGRLDVLVNNAGYYKYGPIEEADEESYHRHFDVNVLGVLLLIRASVAHLEKSAGSIINIGSVAARALPPTTTLYGASKAAVDAITKALAKELGPRGIRINTISPGPIRTQGMMDSGILDSAIFGGQWEKAISDHTPLGRVGETDDVVPTATFLASDDARWITGEILSVSGGC